MAGKFYPAYIRILYNINKTTIMLFTILALILSALNSIYSALFYPIPKTLGIVRLAYWFASLISFILYLLILNDITL